MGTNHGLKRNADALLEKSERPRVGASHVRATSLTEPKSSSQLNQGRSFKDLLYFNRSRLKLVQANRILTAMVTAAWRL